MIENKQHSFRQYLIPLQLFVIVVLIFSAGVLFGSQVLVSQAQNSGLPEEAEEAFAPLFQSYNLIQQQYIEDVENEQLVNAAINGMVESLEDEYSNYVEPEFFEYMDDNMSGEIEGIGATIQENDQGLIEIVNVLPDTPAERAGVKVGDIFFRVDGEDVTGWNTLELVTVVRGPSGSTVNITFLRNGEEIEFSIVRAPIQIPNVETDLLEGDIAYIRLVTFNAIARDQLEEAIRSFNLNEINGLVLDLRDNPGGFLTTATEVAGLFLKDGTILTEEFGDGRSDTFTLRDGKVVQIDSNGNERDYSDNATYYALDVPVVILVNERSASASELVAGAWQDYGVVTVMGEVTFGKGSVQIQNTLVNGGGLRLTVARWLTPNGNSISEQGVTPDILIPVDEEQLEFEEDPQLDAAVRYLQTGEIPPQPEATEEAPEGATEGTGDE